MTDTKTRDAEATRKAILTAAERIFADKGFAEATTSEIADAAGVTKSLIHHYFGTKNGLWTAVKAHRFAEYAEIQHKMLTESEGTAGLLRDSMATYFRFLGRNPDFVRLLGWVLLEDPGKPGFESGEELTRLGIERVREAQAKGLLRSDVDPFHVLMAFLGLCEHWFQGKAHHCAGIAEMQADDRRYHDDIQKIFFEGVLPR